MGNLSPDDDDLRRAHPLAQALIQTIGARPARVLDFGSGSGRNTRALQAAGFDVVAVADNAAFEPRNVPPFEAALSTHALLHGTPGTVSAAVAAVAACLREDAPFYATFASTRDARFGQGRRIDDQTYAPESGDETGVAHVYFNETALRAMLERHFHIDALEERDVDRIVGRWAHAQAPTGSVHWFARLRKPAS